MMKEREKTINPETGINNQIFQKIDSFFNKDEKDMVDYVESPEEIKRLFRKVDNLLDNHGQIESYQVKKEAKDYPRTINHRVFSLRESGYLIRFFEEKYSKGKSEISIRIEEGGDYHSLGIKLQEDNVAIHYGMEGYNKISKVELNKTGELVDLLERKK